MLPRWPGLTATHMRALRKNCVSPGSLKAISANRYTDRACHPEHFWIAARCAACSHTPSASGCPHRVKLRPPCPIGPCPLYPRLRKPLRPQTSTKPHRTTAPSPAADTSKSQTNAGTSITATCASARSQNASAFRLMKIHGVGFFCGRGRLGRALLLSRRLCLLST
jgi:hypothetical protein